MQNYLKSMKDRIVYEVNKCKTLSLPLGINIHLKP